MFAQAELQTYKLYILMKVVEAKWQQFSRTRHAFSSKILQEEIADHSLLITRATNHEYHQHRQPYLNLEYQQTRLLIGYSATKLRQRPSSRKNAKQNKSLNFKEWASPTSISRIEISSTHLYMIELMRSFRTKQSISSHSSIKLSMRSVNSY